MEVKIREAKKETNTIEGQKKPEIVYILYRIAPSLQGCKQFRRTQKLFFATHSSIGKIVLGEQMQFRKAQAL
jgi:hypothetical protein